MSAINRDKAIEVIEDELDKIDHVPQWVFDRLTNRLRELPLAEPHWIPVSDRLPDTDGTYLVWADKSFIPDHADENNICRGRYLATFNKTYCEWWSDNLENIYAWMPLPEPPKEIHE